MKKILLISIASLLALTGVGFSASIEVQDFGYSFGFAGIQKDAHRFAQIQVSVSLPDVVKLVRALYEVDDVVEQLPFVVARNAFVLTNKTNTHGAADEEVMYQIDSSAIAKILHASQDFEVFYQKIRIAFIKFLLAQKYPSFNNRPYIAGNFAILAQSGDFKVLYNITQDDALDNVLKDKLQKFQGDFAALKQFTDHLDFKNISISPAEYAHLGTIFMFKNEQDLRDLGYELVSRKIRTNTDPDYRRHNIMTAFSNIGNVRLIMPGQIFSLAKEFHYSPYADDESQPFVDGYVTVGNGAIMLYGGGLCGVATAFYQGTLTNLGFDLLEYKAHSTYYRNLYEAEINGSYIKDPGLDATVFTPHFDVKVKNIRDYPIVTVFNFDGTSGSIEQVFTLAKEQDKGSFTFVGKTRKGVLQCFTRKINGRNRTNCYRYIKNF